MALAGFTHETITVWLWFRQERKATQFPIPALRDINSFDLRSRQRHDGQIRDELRITQPSPVLGERIIANARFESLEKRY
ncbi:hypothetical protein [Edaphobacter modestus]|uniref:hypothetical protein n=1 Tax=Edaphobacter modestus TaxID=388466 RepID=UPI0013EE7292|nr:hypothetical protein [Edaphobacter modestus]